MPESPARSAGARGVRNWHLPDEVRLNPDRAQHEMSRRVT